MTPRHRRNALLTSAFTLLALILAAYTRCALRSIHDSVQSRGHPVRDFGTVDYADVLDHTTNINHPILTLAARNETLIQAYSDDLDVHVTWPKSNKYTAFLAKGCKLYENLRRRRSDITGSTFSEISALDDNGWEISDPSTTTDDRLRQLLGSIEGPLKDKGISITTAAGNINIEATHTATQGKYFEVYNAKLGLLVAYRNYSPTWMKANNEAYKDAKVLDLQKWSDVVYLVWAKITNGFQRANLRYVVRLNVQNENTNDVVSEALKKVGISSGVPPAWPGYTFQPEGEGLQPFQAVLGTPNLYGVAFMLLQHAGQMGRKTIKSVTVWDKSGMANQDMGWSLCIMIEVGDLP